MVLVRSVQIRGDDIRLGQFLKLADLVDSGSDVRPLVAAGEVSVNGTTETRRGRRLARGDVVALGGDEVRVG
ncbi:MAG: RNA-binding S4 domain-containing protein [Nocardioidaceae bacterium]